MEFIGEYTSEEDIKKFDLDKLLNKHRNHYASYKHYWVIDKKTNSWLVPIKQINNIESLWIFHYKNTNIEIKLHHTDGRWDLIYIEQNSLNNQDIIYSLHRALKVLDTTGIIYATEIKEEMEEDVKENVKEKIKTTISTEKNEPKPTNKKKFIHSTFPIITVILVALFYAISFDTKSLNIKTISKTSYKHKQITNINKSFNAIKLKKCYMCHGKNWSKSALGKSAIVKNMSKDEIFRALKGYKNGTYGGELKAIMKIRVAKFTDKELREIANIIKN